MDLVVIALTFAAIFVVELPDKTFLATLVLSTRYRPVLVWIGVGLAFAVQTLVAVLLGHAVSFLPEDLVRAAAALMFLIGAVLLFREGRSHHQASDDEAEIAAKAKDVHGAQGHPDQLPHPVRRRVGRPVAAADDLAGREVREPGQRVHRRAGRPARRQRARGPVRPRRCSRGSRCTPCTTSAPRCASRSRSSRRTSCSPEAVRPGAH